MMNGAGPTTSFTQRLARAILRLLGWSITGAPPSAPPYLLIGAPHTSNWDFPLAMLAMPAIGFRFRWVGKHTLFRWPMGVVMRALGGIALDRAGSRGFVAQLVALYQAEANLVIAIAPEGTRSHTDHWRSGFYHVARGAGIPVVMGYLDYARREMGISAPFKLSGDVDADMRVIRDFYADIQGKHPAAHGPVRLREKD